MDTHESHPYQAPGRGYPDDTSFKESWRMFQGIKLPALYPVVLHEADWYYIPQTLEITGQEVMKYPHHKPDAFAPPTP